MKAIFLGGLLQARMKLLTRLSLPWIVVGFAVGLVATWLIRPKRQVVIEFPSPYNAGRVTYGAAEGKCFQYRADSVKCPDDGERVTVQPVPRDEPFCAQDGPSGLQDGPDELSPHACKSVHGHEA